MNKLKYDIKEEKLNEVAEEQVAYDTLEKKRLKESILMSDTDKFLLFTKLMRIGKMLKNAKVTHSNSTV